MGKASANPVVYCRISAKGRDLDLCPNLEKTPVRGGIRAAELRPFRHLPSFGSGLWASGFLNLRGNPGPTKERLRSEALTP